MDNSKDQTPKGFFWGYIVIAIVAILGGTLSIYSRIAQVNDVLFGLDPTPGPVETESQKRLKALAEKKLLDSDSDTLTDFDEEITYGTSAYLDDTDSDGVKDNEEIAQGSDPNCATGSACFTTATTNTNTATASETDLAGLDTSDPQELRSQLLALGIDKTVLDQVSDEELIQVYSSVQQDYSGQTTTTSGTSENATGNGDNTNAYNELLPDTDNDGSISSVTTYQDLQELTPEAVRDLLLQSGMSADDLSQIDDATLMSVYADALSQAEQENTASQ